MHLSSQTCVLVTPLEVLPPYPQPWVYGLFVGLANNKHMENYQMGWLIFKELSASSIEITRYNIWIYNRKKWQLHFHFGNCIHFYHHQPWHCQIESFPFLLYSFKITRWNSIRSKSVYSLKTFFLMHFRYTVPFKLAMTWTQCIHYYYNMVRYLKFLRLFESPFVNNERGWTFLHFRVFWRLLDFRL